MISTTNIEEQLVEVNSPLSNIPENSSEEAIRDTLNDCAFKNNFVVIQKSEEKRLVFVCKNGPGCKDWRNISSLDRKRIIPSKKMNCLYTIRLSKKNNDDDTLMSTHEGRMYKLSSGGFNMICDGVKQSKSTKSIQKSISTYAKFNKLKRHDINDLRYSKQKLPDCL
ncbi:hypothetical protein G6F56_004576 [Rhizopus delemar]|nr:hypothetical protein G6F56_004576 [Rhizopus delemar]